ncbi:uncharacterized protein LTHEOB_5489 [Neofusicoccum parvum]|uniref:Uncharacterized protein LTHEOB_5489 n=1 Tax=Neofusicoccum parvum TaxID=310453 RepID=A0ACB5SIA6_9PEZI|nr:uncharacterized protein LTHEOB_5489 [Neofusicoccum parvum]
MDGRQPPSDDHATPSNSRNSRNPNVFDDEYSLERDQESEYGFGVADGFRPGQENGGAGAGNSATALDHRASIRSSVRRSISENFPLDTKNAPAIPQPRNSIVKGGHAPRGSLTMAQDGPNSSTPERSNTYSPAPRLPPLTHRASIASTSSFATEHASQSGFAGNSGPSHPYGMYPQGTGLARSSSVTTTSTIQTPQRSLSNHGPAHPYAMYPQNVFEDPDEIQPAPVQNQIPVGFPGLGQGYHRQIGPDGEEQDIIGPDGHTEQLPPYSRFPEEGPTKASLMAVPEEFGLVTTAATGGAAATSQDVTPAVSPIGVVIGTFMAKEHMKGKGKDKGPAMVTVISTESLFDASNIPIPTGLPQLPLGKYALPIRSPDVSSNECLTSSEQNDAWSCNVEGPPLEINLGTSGKANSFAMWLQPLENTTAINYGSQAPNIKPQSLSLVTDLDNPTDGPAWHFQTLYDKIVILRPEEFAAGQNLKRHAHASGSADDYGPPPYPPDGFSMPQGFKPRHQVVAGDTPCNQLELIRAIDIRDTSSDDFSVLAYH